MDIVLSGPPRTYLKMKGRKLFFKALGLNYVYNFSMYLRNKTVKRFLKNKKRTLLKGFFHIDLGVVLNNHTAG